MSKNKDLDRKTQVDSIPKNNSLGAGSMLINSKLDEIERRLQSEPTRIQWGHVTEGGNLQALSFHRQGDSWAFAGRFKQSSGEAKWLRLSEMSLLQKAEVAKCLPAFLKGYVAERAHLAKLIHEASLALIDAEQILGGR